MKVDKKNKATALRKQGVSMGEIARRLNVAKSSVSYWVRDIPLTKEQRGRLNANGHSIDAIEKRRIARLANTKARRDEMIRNAIDEVEKLSTDPLWCVGTALYWGEGGKTQQTARLSNSDPVVIRIMMKFFLKYSGVSKDKYHGHIHTFSEQNAKVALSYWSGISGIPEDKFYKTYVKQSSASKHKRKTLEYGTVQIYIHDTNFFFRLMGWMKGLERRFA
jgi:transposase-like protein